MSKLIIYSSDGMKNLNATERQIYTEVKMEAAAEGIFNVLDKDLQKKYNQKQIFNLIKHTDKDKNGIITDDEAKDDIDNIFGLQKSENTDKLEKIQASINKELELSDLKGLRKGLDTNRALWPIAKPLIINYTTKEGLKDMFSSKEAVKFYSEEIGKNKETNKHLAELFKAQGFSVEDIKNIGFSEKVLNEILSFYK